MLLDTLMPRFLAQEQLSCETFALHFPFIVYLRTSLMKNIALRVKSIHMYHDEWQFHRMIIEHSSSYPGTQSICNIFIKFLV